MKISWLLEYPKDSAVISAVTFHSFESFCGFPILFLSEDYLFFIQPVDESEHSFILLRMKLS